jgi:hypothetical protein
MTEQEAVETTIRILAFTGKDEDWNMWLKKFIATASRRGYKKILSGKELQPDPSEDEDDLSEGQLKVRRLNEKAYNDMLLACTDEVSFGIVDSSQQNDEGNARLAWV